MIYLDIDPIQFGIKHGIKIKTEKCHLCGSLVTVDRPVISKDYVGFESEPHYSCEAIIKYVKPLNKHFLDKVKED
jgi:hypothetical protein